MRAVWPPDPNAGAEKLTASASTHSNIIVGPTTALEDVAPPMPEQIRAKHYDVFVSYKRADGDTRDVLIEALQEASFRSLVGRQARPAALPPQLATHHQLRRGHALWSENAHAAPDEVR